MEEQMHYIIRIGDGVNFINSSKYNCWGLNSNNNNAKHLIKNIKENDILWFIKNKTKGQVIAVSNYTRNEKRILGPLINISKTNEELGWDNIENIDTIIYYDNIYNISRCNIFINLKGQNTIYKYSNDKYNIDLKKEYDNIIKYSNITTIM
jgi:hypothetical protein